MGYIGALTLGDTEMSNVSRTAQLAQGMGIDIVRVRPSQVVWIEDALVPGSPEYFDITTAPWYDAGNPDSEEFAGVLALSVDGMDSSTQESSPVEYISDGGSTGKGRNATLALVFNVALVASTERGLDYGTRWLKHLLLNADDGGPTCVGPALEYFGYEGKLGEDPPPFMHRNRVKLTRGLSITRRRSNECSVMALATFTMVAGDPYEYSERTPWIADLGDAVASGDGWQAQGDLVLEEESCPVYDYTPVYDPLYPALVAPPALPNLQPQGWTIEPGQNFHRDWVAMEPFNPRTLSLVPVLTLSTSVVARMVRVSIWSIDVDNTDSSNKLCEPLWSAVISYLPTGFDFLIDGEHKTSYTWDGTNSRLATSLVYSPQARPIEWKSFNGLINKAGAGFMISLDTFEKTGGGYEGGGTVRANLAFVTKSD